MAMTGPSGSSEFSSVERPTVPFVSAICIVGEDERINLARSAVTSFLRQTYPNFEVIIVCAAPTKTVLDNEWETLREFQVDPVQYPTIGALRNKGIEEAKGDWILPFDDDDHNHLHRLFIQMAAREPGHCVTLSEQVRIDIDRNMMCTFSNPAGLPSTILFPRLQEDGKTLNLYDADMLDEGEDQEFLDRNFGEAKNIVIPTSTEWFPGSCTSIAYYHSRNKSSRERFFGRYANNQYEGKVASEIPDDHMEYVQSVMEAAGLATKVDRGAGAVGPVGAPTV